MPDIIITYDTLYEILRREKSRRELQKLDLNFFQSIRDYIKGKRLILESQKSTNIFITEIQKTEKQLENIDKIVQQLYERRERKIIEIALISSRSKKPSPELTLNMLQKEKDFYNDLVEVINKNKDTIFYELTDNQEKTKILKSEKEENSNTLIRFLESVPKFVTLNGFIHGPFEKEDIANLPTKIATILIKKNRAEKIKT